MKAVWLSPAEILVIFWLVVKAIFSGLKASYNLESPVAPIEPIPQAKTSPLSKTANVYCPPQEI